jgi:hypothetical protein
MLEQSEQHLKGLFLNADEPAITAEFAGCSIGFKSAEPDPLRPSAAHPVRHPAIIYREVPLRQF